jgi:hypothetical protein
MRAASGEGLIGVTPANLEPAIELYARASYATAAYVFHTGDAGDDADFWVRASLAYEQAPPLFLQLARVTFAAYGPNLTEHWGQYDSSAAALLEAMAGLQQAVVCSVHEGLKG